jgi:hypothetical protein
MKPQPKKVTKRTKIRHKKFLNQTCLDKGNTLRVINNVIMSSTYRRIVNSQYMIMSTGRETSNSDHRSKLLKPCMRGLLKAVERATKTAYRAICNRIPRWWLHINLLTQLTIKKDILNIKIRHKSMANRCHDKNSLNGGHVNHKSKSLIIIIDMLLLKAMSDHTSFITLKGPTYLCTRGGRGTISHIPVCSSAAISSAMASCHLG